MVDVFKNEMINTGFSGNLEASHLPEAAKEHIRQICNVYGIEGVNQWIMMPNASYGNRHNSPPTGAVVVFEKNAPFLPEAFAKNDFMTGGTALILIKGCKDRSQQLNEAYIQRVSKNLTRKMRELEENRTQSEISLAILDQKKLIGKDLGPWEPSLGGEGSYIGVVKGVEQTDSNRIEKFYLVVRSSAKAISRGLCDWLNNNKLGVSTSSNATTVSTSISAKDFTESIHASFAENAGRRNRKRLLALAAEIMGVHIDTRTDTAAYINENNNSTNSSSNRRRTLRPKIAIPDIENVSHHVRYFDDIQKVVYYSNCTSTNSNTPGVIISQSIKIGPVIHWAKQVSNNQYGGWRNDKTFHGYPVDTGRDKDIRSLGSKVNINASEQDNFSFNKGEWNAQLVPEYYRPMNKKFKDATEILGHDSELPKQSLQPIFMILGYTKKPKTVNNNTK